MPKPRKIPSTITCEFITDIVAAKDGDDGDKLATFKIKAYTGSPMQVGGFYDPVVIALDGLKASSKIPILHGHQHDRIVGHSTSVSVDKNVVVEGVVSGVGYYAKEVVQSSQKGFPWQASVGARIEKAQFIEEGESVEVNGKTHQGPLIVAQRTRLYEVSFVPIGADSKTTTKVAAQPDDESFLEVFPMKFEEFVASLGLELESLTKEQTAALQAKFDAGMTVEAVKKSIEKKKKAPETKTEPVVPPVTDPGADLLAAGREQAAADAERISGISILARKPEFEEVPKLAEIQAKAIREGWTTDKFELECRRTERPDPRSFSRGRSDSDKKKLGQTLECAVARQCGQFSDEQMEKWYPEDVLEAADKSRYRGAGVHMLFDNAIEAAGGHYSGSRKSNDYIRAAFKADREILANAGFSTISVSQILENVANKALIAGYSAVQVSWPSFCAVHNLSDFKPASRYRLDSQGSFRIVPSSGEIKHVSLSDDKYTKQLDTYGAILALNRQQIINDDLNAFMDIPRLLGRMAAIRLEEAVYTLLLANATDFFDAGNGNLTDAVFSLAGVTTAEEIFMNQVDSNGKPILMSPNVLLVPTSLSTEADDLYANSTVDQMVFTDTAGVTIARNPHKGKYPPTTSPYINNTAITNEDGNAITGQTATQWYLFADPAVRAAIAVGLLNGSRVPMLESAETDFNTLGMQWRAYSDFGVGYEDPKAAVKSSGDAT